MFETQRKNWMVAGLAAAIASIGSMPEVAAAASRAELCTRLSRQIDAAIPQEAETRQAAAARLLQRKADKLCADRKPAQGIRIHASALKLLGVSPVIDN